MMYDVLLSGIKMIHVAEHFKWIHAVTVHCKVASIHTSAGWRPAVSWRWCAYIACLAVIWQRRSFIISMLSAYPEIIACGKAKHLFKLSKSWQGKHKTADKNAKNGTKWFVSGKSEVKLSYDFRFLPMIRLICKSSKICIQIS